MNIDPRADRGDYAVALVVARGILARWREEIEKGVSEGEDRLKYSSSLKPAAKTESEKVAMKLLQFREVDVSKLKTVQPTMQEKARELSKRIVESSNETDPLYITYLSSSSSSDSDSEDEATPVTKTKATAVKNADGGWTVVVKGGPVMEVQESDLLDDSKFLIDGAFTDQNVDEKKRQAANIKRQRQWDWKQKEKELGERARVL